MSSHKVITPQNQATVFFFILYNIREVDDVRKISYSVNVPIAENIAQIDHVISSYGNIQICE